MRKNLNGLDVGVFDCQNFEVGEFDRRDDADCKTLVKWILSGILMIEDELFDVPSSDFWQRIQKKSKEFVSFKCQSIGAKSLLKLPSSSDSPITWINFHKINFNLQKCRLYFLLFFHYSPTVRLLVSCRTVAVVKHWRLAVCNRLYLLLFLHFLIHCHMFCTCKLRIGGLNSYKFPPF